MMIFRMDKSNVKEQSPKEMQESISHWQNWIGGIAAQEKFISTNQLGFEAKVLNSDSSITDGPFAEIKEIVGGYIIVKANSLDEAVEMANGCPILFIGGTVEVRDVMQLNA